MLKIGLTGGIGSGKSTIAKVFEVLLIPIYNSDTRAKWLQDNDIQVVQAISKLFGEHIYNESGALNRTKISQSVFSNKELLHQLNAIMHPAVALDFSQWLSQQNSPYCIKEAAILFESGAYKGLDKIITVVAPTTIRVARVINRDNTSEKEVYNRIANQWTDSQKIELSDFVIHNDDETLVIPQVLSIHNQLLALK